MAQKHKPILFTVDQSSYFRAGDIVRISTTGDTFVCAAANARPLHGPVRKTWREMLRDALRLRFGRNKVAKVGEQHTLRVWKLRPSPLPRRLP